MTPPQAAGAHRPPEPPRPDAAPARPGPQAEVPFPQGGEGLGEALRAPYAALVVTASNRASAGVYADRGGPLLAEGLASIGFAVDGPLVVPDGDPVEQALRAGTAAGYDVIVTTGGTGLSPTDRTPEVTRAVIEYDVPGIPEAIRAEGLAKVPTAALSRGLAGVAGGRTLIINLPGSTGGVRDGIAVLERILRHAVDQIRGGDHPRPGSSS
ncbi:molybdenum cofactor biosynthesis protein B [Streptomyces sp. NBC_00083]|uniref:MogA/MoaB family molybdenum cofactor biosynthesis protein n=1 Tax=Streptomyces sp. NBC_00083 TaxID=2975647 RepID=UPI0022518084|nr:MogA/MoaB family molybdenum cofactor biosynthesis protein [Streptomyces sp. NBC_00083]MCX5381926.1 MogA/MoaB family molybdenum cofactor biosynthesis protein [Streptomyces sp. NBC_00083]